jgi:hypothetical protein
MSQTLQDDLYPELVRLLEVCARKTAFVVRDYKNDKEAKKAVKQSREILARANGVTDEIQHISV